MRRHSLDTIGAALAGARQPEAEAALEAGRAVYGAEGPAAVWGRDHLVPPGVAAFVNGAAAHALELDDTAGCDHSGAVVVPALVAALPLAPEASAGDLIAAVTAGYDVGRRVMEAAGGYDPHNNAGWHSTGTCGVFAAAAAVARLTRCDAATFASALGVAGSMSSGTWAFLADGAMTKRIHPGHAAASGLLATMLARSGLVGPAQVFEASWGGFLTTYARGDARPEALTAGLGESWRILGAAIKPFASCRGAHGAAEAMLDLRAGGLRPEEVDAVEVGCNATVLRMCGAKDIESMVDAQMSLPYAVAVALLHGAADLPMYAEAVRRDPKVLAQVRAIEMRVDPSVTSSIAAEVAVRLKGGETRRRRIDDPLGSATRPLPDEALRAKYRGLAEPAIGPGRAKAVEAAVWTLGQGGEPAALARALAPP